MGSFNTGQAFGHQDDIDTPQLCRDKCRDTNNCAHWNFSPHKDGFMCEQISATDSGSFQESEGSFTGEPTCSIEGAIEELNINKDHSMTAIDDNERLLNSLDAMSGALESISPQDGKDVDETKLHEKMTQEMTMTPLKSS